MKIARVFAAVFAASLVAACSTTKPEPQIRIVEVKVPVAVSCVPENLPPRPGYRVTASDIVGAPDAAERYRLAAAGFQERDARLNEVEPVVEGCRKAGHQ